jgi:murein DD-endopeptidase MepM/ murein hydrolase activator NlpD
MGTPVVSAGAATVKSAGFDGGSGNAVSLVHAGGFETRYSHLASIAAGLHPGAPVFQGQEIGTIGATGLATGTHLHFEVLVNGRHFDPMAIALPRARLPDASLADFQRERIRLDALLRLQPRYDLVAPK